MGRRPPSVGPCVMVGLIAFGVACSDARPFAVEERVRCAECHGFPPTSGAHPNHTTASQLYGKTWDCIQCHFKPPDNQIDVPGHILDDLGRPVSPTNTLAPLVRFDQPGALAPLVGVGDRSRVGPPSYDPATKQCTGVYCHGGTFDFDTRATREGQKPIWRDGAPQPAPCGSCHGIPPSNHVIAAGSTTVLDINQLQCLICHVGIDANGVPSPQTHINGTVDLKPGAVLPLDFVNCNVCHGDPKTTALSATAAAAPPLDLRGNATGPKVGAHQVHLTPGDITGGFACGECHVVPKKPSDPGHIGATLTATVTFGTLPACTPGVTFPPACSIAKLGSATPVYDLATQTCSSTYCHAGGGTFDPSDSADHAPTWTGSVSCGTSCHQVPPPTGVHSNKTITDCVDCHPASIDANGNIIVKNGSSAHVNGRVSFDTP